MHGHISLEAQQKIEAKASLDQSIVGSESFEIQTTWDGDTNEVWKRVFDTVVRKYRIRCDIACGGYQEVENGMDPIRMIYIDVPAEDARDSVRGALTELGYQNRYKFSWYGRRLHVHPGNYSSAPGVETFHRVRVSRTAW